MIGWQKSNTSTSAGISGCVDENEWYYDIDIKSSIYVAPPVEEEEVKEVVLTA